MRSKRFCAVVFVFICLVVSFLCTGCNNSKDKLVICTDLSSYNLVESAIETWKENHPDGMSVEAEILAIPNDDTAAEIKITEIRTEIMSGDGPDVFIMKTGSSLVVDYDRNESLLFTNPEKAMYSEIFLPLDSYLDSWEYLDLEDCNQSVLQAGQTEEGQLLLPITYDYHACIFPNEEPTEIDKYPKSWDEFVNDEQLKKMIYKRDPRGFLAYLGPYADYEKEELLISEEDIINQLEQCLHRDIEHEKLQCATVNEGFFREKIGMGNNQLHNFYAIPNVDGGVTANVSMYSGINRNTRFAEEAASFLDSFYGVMKHYPKTPDEGIFIEQDEEVQSIYMDEYFVSEEDVESFLKMNETVTDARFYSTWDYDLVDTYWSLRWNPEKSIESAVDEIYQKMQMQIKE